MSQTKGEGDESRRKQLRLSGRVRGGAAAFLAMLLFAVTACAYPAEVENIPPERYFEVTLNEIRQAESFIHLYMYLVILPPMETESVVYRLVNALAEAKERGVNVRVVLDQNVDWTEGSAFGFWDPSGKNRRAYEYLRQRGVDVFFDDKTDFTHAKLLVIDKETVILGSSNWSEKALTRNLETNVLIRSQECAEELLQGFEALELHAPALSDPSSVSVPWAFLNSPDLIGGMVAAHDEGAFDAYLYLLKIFNQSDEKSITLGYESLIAELGFKSAVKAYNRRSVREVLGRLQDKYGLTDFSYVPGENPDVSLRVNGNPAGPRGTTQGKIVRVPPAYWDWGWNKELTLGGKVMYLVGKMYSDLSPTAPVWFRSIRDIAKAPGFSERFVQDGLMNLRRHNLLEVKPGKLSPPDFSDRKANEYILNPLYDPEKLEQAFKKLSRRYGNQKVKRATGYASLVYEDSDVVAIGRLIILEEEFGREVVQRAVERVSAMRGTNPKRAMGYLINTIRRMGSKGKGRF